MIWIEFMGPAGVGKSFLYNKVINSNPTLSPRRIFIENFFLEKKIKNTDFINSIFYKLKIKQETIINRTLLASKDNLSDSFDESDKLHIEIFIDGLKNYDSNAINQLRLANFYYDKLKEFKVFNTYFKKEDYYLSEDGIMHLNFGDFSNFNKNIRLPDVVVSIDAPDNHIFNNRLNRINDGRANLLEKMLPVNHLKQYVLDYNKKYRLKIKKIRDLDIKIIDFKINNETIESDLITLMDQIKIKTKITSI